MGRDERLGSQSCDTARERHQAWVRAAAAAWRAKGRDEELFRKEERWGCRLLDRGVEGGTWHDSDY